MGKTIVKNCRPEFFEQILSGVRRFDIQIDHLKKEDVDLSLVREFVKHCTTKKWEEIVANQNGDDDEEGSGKICYDGEPKYVLFQFSEKMYSILFSRKDGVDLKSLSFEGVLNYQVGNALNAMETGGSTEIIAKVGDIIT